jgi:hypothetical protein
MRYKLTIFGIYHQRKPENEYCVRHKKTEAIEKPLVRVQARPRGTRIVYELPHFDNSTHRLAMSSNCGHLTAFVLLLYATVVVAHVDISQQKMRYWGERGLENPSRRLRELADWSLLYFNTSRAMRPVLLFTIATPASTSGVLSRVLENLDKFKSNDQFDVNGSPTTSLAEHTLVASTSMDAQRGCDSLTERYHHVGRCRLPRFFEP